MNSEIKYEKIRQKLGQLRLPEELPDLSFDPNLEPARSVAFRTNLVAAGAGALCFAIVIGAVAWAMGWQNNDIILPPASTVTSVPSIPSVVSEPEVSSEEVPVSSEEISSSELSSVAVIAPSQESAPVNSAPEPFVSTVTNRTVTPLEITQWEALGNNTSSKESHAVLLRSSEELRAWLTERSKIDSMYDIDWDEVFFPIASDTGAYDHETRIAVEELVEKYSPVFEQGNVILGTCTYYPGRARESFSSLTVTENLLTVQAEATEVDGQYYTNRITTLAVLSAEDAKGVEQVKIETQFATDTLYTPETIPESPYTTRKWNIFSISLESWESAGNKDAILSSIEELSDWLDKTFIGDSETIPVKYEDMDRAYWDENSGWKQSADAANSKEAILAEFTPFFEQGGRLLAIAASNGNFSGYSRGLRKIERVEDRLVVHYDYYNHSSTDLPALSTHLYLTEIDSALADGATSIEMIKTTYKAPME